MLNTADVARPSTQPPIEYTTERPPSTADTRKKSGIKVASFLLKTMLQKRAATTIKEGGGVSNNEEERNRE